MGVGAPVAVVDAGPLDQQPIRHQRDSRTRHPAATSSLSVKGLVQWGMSESPASNSRPAESSGLA